MKSERRSNVDSRGGTPDNAPHDNVALRALFSLPPIQASASTALTVPEMPVPKTVTGDRELDAVLWLQECVGTGHQELIDNALEAAKKISTPMKDLSTRYGQYLARQHGSTFMAALGSMGFGQLEDQAKAAIEKKRRQHVALSRFDTVEALFNDTPAEAACKKALRGLKCNKDTHYLYDDGQARARFAKKQELQPFTLGDCLYARTYWTDLYKLRSPFGDCGDPPPYGGAHDDYSFAMLAKIAPRSKEEALQVYQHLEENEGLDREETPSILRNLISGGWA